MNNFCLYAIFIVAGILGFAACVIGLLVNPGLTITIWLGMYFLNKLEKLASNK